VTSGMIWIWGRHPVLEALRAERATSVLLAVGQRSAPVVEEILSQARLQGVPVREVTAKDLDSMSPGATTQGVAATVTMRRVETVEGVLAGAAKSDQKAFLLILDQIQDPHNFGALLRSAEAAGIHAVVVPERRSAPLAGTVAKTSAGALSLVPILEVTNLARTLDELKRSGIWIVGLDATAGVTLFDADLTVPLALVIGGEGDGLRRLTREKCDLLVSLPMRGVISSLNASVAGAVAMFECVRQRLEVS
jgi:23S rRNA (guanosine2251-2'-O)-methyltransferase